MFRPGREDIRNGPELRMSSEVAGEGEIVEIGDSDANVEGQVEGFEDRTAGEGEEERHEERDGRILSEETTYDCHKI